MRMFVYHYQAEYRPSGVNVMTVTSFDGIAHLAKKILSMDDYRELKSLIVKDLMPAIAPDNLIICSLTPLGETRA